MAICPLVEDTLSLFTPNPFDNQGAALLAILLPLAATRSTTGEYGTDTFVSRE